MAVILTELILTDMILGEVSDKALKCRSWSPLTKVVLETKRAGKCLKKIITKEEDLLQQAV